MLLLSGQFPCCGSRSDGPCTLRWFSRPISIQEASRKLGQFRKLMTIHTATRNLTRRTTLLMLFGATGLAVAQGPPNRGPGGPGPDDRGRDFHFRDQDRARFQPHYRKDVDRWRSRPQGRPRFSRGQRIPNNIRFQPVPRSYWAGVPAPPPGYQYGYYDGYVVAYNPTTRIIADVLDLVAAASR